MINVRGGFRLFAIATSLAMGATAPCRFAAAQRAAEFSGTAPSGQEEAPAPTATPIPEKRVCVIDQYNQFQVFSYVIPQGGAPKFNHTAARGLDFPADASDFNVKIRGYSVDDYSPKLTINGASKINVSEAWRRSYNHLYGSQELVDVSSLLHAGRNVLEATATDIRGVVGQHLGLGVCFVGTYRAVACGSEIDEGVRASDSAKGCGQ